MKKPLLVSSSLLAGLLVCLVAANASAQDSTSPPPAAPMASSPPPSSSSSMGGGAIGVGAIEFLSGMSGGQFVYDTPMFHVEALLGYQYTSVPNNGPSTNVFQFGVGGWYHLARGNMADFSLGGSAGLVYTSVSGGGGSSTAFAIEPGAQARVFLSPNFALSGRVGIAITTGDNNTDTVFSIAGQETAAFGFTYFFR
jgi:hypothetical protein